MADQYEEINRPDPAVAGKFRVAVEIVVGDVANQKERGKYRGADHESHVHHALAFSNINVATNQAYGAQRIEQGVGAWQKRHPFGRLDSAFEINQPDEKTGDERA